MKRILFALTSLAFVSLTACPGQVPPTTAVVNLTWTAPAASGSWAGCVSGQPACTYIISRASVATATTACPATSGTAYTPLNAATPATGTTYTDTTVTGFVCYIAQTEQSGLVSQASTAVGVESVPAQPLAPSLSGSVTADAKDGAPQLEPGIVIPEDAVYVHVPMNNASLAPSRAPVLFAKVVRK